MDNIPLQTATVTLPRDKTCAYCTLQWVWVAENDGGSYVGCNAGGCNRLQSSAPPEAAQSPARLYLMA